MKKIIISLAALLLATFPFSSLSEICNEEKRKSLLEPIKKSKKNFFKVDCSIKLSNKDRIEKRIHFVGDEASNIIFDCNGAVIDGRPIKKIRKNKDMDMIEIRSKINSENYQKKFIAPSNITIKNCNLYGSIRVFGLGKNGQSKYVKESSSSPYHTIISQKSAPKKIHFKNMKITGIGRNIFYLSPGVTESSIEESTFEGISKWGVIYLGAETARNKIVKNNFNVRSKKPAISIDGSAYNIISNNNFINPENGGIYLYRNCGEGGTARHQTPSFNIIDGNNFKYSDKTPKKPSIWVSSRSEKSIFCPNDSEKLYGSAISNKSFATHNIVINNTINLFSTENMIRVKEHPNYIYRNRSLSTTSIDY